VSVPIHIAAIDSSANVVASKLPAAKLPAAKLPLLRRLLTPVWVTRWKVVIFLLCMLPFVQLAVRIFTQSLGANPAETLIRSTGEWTLIFLCITLAVTPLKRLTGRPELVRFRRMLGLFTYFYVLLHLLSYSWFDMAFDVSDITRDIIKRPFILVGFAAFCLLTPLAATSFNRAIKALGAKRWQALHKLVYVIAALGLLHFWWMKAGKNDFDRPTLYLVIIGVLMGMRVWWWWQDRKVRLGKESNGKVA
jgi:methionine sulfoxide reductase heme-binding subunit